MAGARPEDVNHRLIEAIAAGDAEAALAVPTGE